MYGFHFVIIYNNKSKTVCFPLAYPDGHIRYFVAASDARRAIKDSDSAQKYGYEIHCLGMGEQ